MNTLSLTLILNTYMSKNQFIDHKSGSLMRHKCRTKTKGRFFKIDFKINVDEAGVIMMIADAS